MMNVEEQTPAPAIFKKASLPITLKFESVVYKIKIGESRFLKNGKKPEERQILKGISGMVAPGEMLGLLGPSGGGKTTLLTALGGRLGGKLSGSITYNGKPFSNAIKRNTGFVHQDDILHPHLTVRETLVFVALLRLPKTLTAAEKVQQAEAVITQLGLAKCENSIVGDHNVRGVSGGERKRISIGLEMLINPSLLFLDEPTSGLDSTTALKIVTTLSELVSGGRTIAMTIHQPSSRLFYLFHKVILLCEGNLLYYGKPSTALDYFSSIGFSPSVPTNPADFLLDLANGVVTGESNEDAAATKAILKSAYEANLSEEVKRELAVDREFESSADGNKKSKQYWSNTWWTQFSVLWKRGMKERKHDYFSFFFITQVVVITIICGLLWWRSHNIQDQVGLLFFNSTFWGFNALFQAVFTFPKERRMLAKERASGMYRLSSYFMALSAGDVPMSLVLPAFFFTVSYWMAGLKASAKCFFSGLFVMLYSVVCTSGLGLAIGALVLDQQNATLTASILMSTFTLVGGYYVQNPPKFISWIKYLSSVNYTFKMLLATQYAKDETYPCGDNRICRVADISFVKSAGSMNGIGLSIGILTAMLLGYRFIAYFALTRLGVPK